MRPEDLFAGFSSPPPPASLRDRVLFQARTTRPEPEPRALDRFWSSRALRTGWAALVLALLLGHAALSLGGPNSPTAGRGDPAVRAADLGLDEGVLPSLPSRRLRQPANPRPLSTLIEVWLDPTLAPGY